NQNNFPPIAFSFFKVCGGGKNCIVEDFNLWLLLSDGSADLAGWYDGGSVDYRSDRRERATAKQRLPGVGLDVAQRLQCSFQRFLIFREVDEFYDVLIEAICFNFVELAECSGQGRERLLHFCKRGCRKTGVDKNGGR